MFDVFLESEIDNLLKRTSAILPEVFENSLEDLLGILENFQRNYFRNSTQNSFNFFPSAFFLENAFEDSFDFFKTYSGNFSEILPWILP